MILSKNLNPDETFIYLERYVNDGSPSGFTEKYNTSEITNPLGPNPCFELLGVNIPDAMNCVDFGKPPNFIGARQLLIHPDMVSSEKLNGCAAVFNTGLMCVPTSSSRTVKILNSPGWFVKLSYDGLIGRIDRQLGIPQASAATEVTDRITTYINLGKLPKRFQFMREPYARVAELNSLTGNYEWGMVLREPQPYPMVSQVKYIIPAFALFSKDRKEKADLPSPTILEQIFRNSNKDPREHLLEDLIFMILESYFLLISQCGLQLECHSQNTLFGLDEEFNILTMISRDAESIDRDISLISELGLEAMHVRSEYKCLRRDQYNYAIMHSFMYDFKLGVYLLDPIIRVICTAYKLDEESIRADIRKFAQKFIQQLPADFFPNDGMWYSYEAIVHDRSKKRNYIATPNPNYR